MSLTSGTAASVQSAASRAKKVTIGQVIVKNAVAAV